MSRNSQVTSIVFVAGLGIGFFGRSAMDTLQRKDKHAVDLAGIEKLHREDVAATLAQDPSLLMNLWADDCVKLGVPGAAIVGKKAMQETYQKFRAEHPDFQVLKYAPEIKDVQVADGWAIEWGYYEATFKMSAKDDPVSVRIKDLRVLKRQSDGSWKFARETESE